MEILGKFEILENFEKVGGKLWRREGYMRPKFSILGGFLAFPTETSFTTPHYYPKYEVSAIEFFLWLDAICANSSQDFYALYPEFHRAAI